ncbi:hypothetical protein M2341_001630 [Sphingobium sp. B7D2B]|uniref:hypothetical protein n=1 Tax=Sphingobium sp. B7D2B TaxID=2940583 RepID=UPI002224807D|nr:hypothetical protein [Sphingobium sp. B7D2B]MCW2366183.1 hypothetical protein [Sphingobium sp. B7D2B]
MFYILGCALFAVAATLAATIMVHELRLRHGAMMRALRTLDLEGWTPERAGQRQTAQPVAATGLSLAIAMPPRAAA